MVAKKQTKSTPAPTATVINRQPAGTPSTQDELAQAKARVAELERNQKQASIAEAEKAIAPAKAAYEKAIAEGQATITAARAAMTAATETYNKVRTEAKLPRVNGGGGVAGPRSDAARTSIAVGAHLNKLAGSPKADAVVAVFGKSGYALSWAKRAERLGMQPEELCKAFVANPEEVHKLWTAKAAKK